MRGVHDSFVPSPPEVRHPQLPYHSHLPHLPSNNEGLYTRKSTMLPV
ncbi:hypothetical protein [Microseira wollei]|nr:hypothetical protein [Microseira wollei]